MSVPATARVVVIGAGIVGNSLVHHLARLGWRDIVQIDKGALPNPGGSTGHASNFIFPVDHSREMTDLTLDSVRQYKELGVFTESGGYEVARTEERMEELRRRMSSAKAWGIHAELVTPDHVVERVPFLEKDKILGAFWTPSVGVVDSLRAGTLMRESALALGALTVVSTVEVIGMDVEEGRIRRVRTTGGDIEAETVVIACGVWSPKLARMAGAHIPLTPAVHQMISVGPIPQLAERPGEISFPIVRDMDTFCYERQHGADMEVGSYAHRAILHDPEDIPSIEQARLSPTEMPFTADDFDPQLEQALELMPDALGADGAEIRYAINGLLSLTPDGAADPRRDARGQGPLVGGRRVDQGRPRHRPGGGGVDDPRPLGDRRPPLRHRPVLPAPAHPRARAGPHRRGLQQDLRHRAPRRAVGQRARQARSRRCTPPRRPRARCSSRPSAGSGRCGTRSNEALLGEYGDAVLPREHEWDSRWWSPIINAEHLAMRERAGIVDLSAFAIFDVVGPGAAQAVQKIVVAQADVGEGRVIYTPVLDAKGGFRSDLTVMRLAHNRYRVVTGGAHGMADLKWFADHLDRRRPDRRPDLGVHHDRAVGPEGPRHPRPPHRRRHLARRLPVPAPAAPSSSATWRCSPPGSPTSASWAGSSTCRWSRAPGCGTCCTRRASPMARCPSASACTAPPAASRRATARTASSSTASARSSRPGMQRPKVKAADFVGRDAYVAQRDQAPQTVLCTLTVDDHTSAAGGKRYMLGGEPIRTRDGGVLTDGHGHHPYVTTAGSAPSLGKHVLMAYLPPDQAVVGNQLAVSYMEELYPVTVGSIDATPLFDPSNDRIKG